MLADELIGGEAAQGLQAAGVIVGGDEVGEMLAEPIVAVVMAALDGYLLDGAVHPLDLTAGPGMLHLGEAVLDAVLLAAHVEHVGDMERSARRRSAAGR